MKQANIARFAWLSIGAAILTIALKTRAYWLTGSVSLLSDAQLFTHLEPQGNPAAWEDIGLDRKDNAAENR